MSFITRILIAKNKWETLVYVTQRVISTDSYYNNVNISWMNWKNTQLAVSKHKYETIPHSSNAVIWYFKKSQNSFAVMEEDRFDLLEDYSLNF